MSALSPGEVDGLIRSLAEGRSLLERVRGQDHRIDVLRKISASGQVRVVPYLVPFIADDASLAPHVARAVAELVGDISPVQLAGIDERVRASYYDYGSRAWARLSPDAVTRLAQIADFDPSVVGLIASHHNGYVRAAALDVLAQHNSGQDIPFLALRANDWVEPVAKRATALLVSRLRPDNRHAVLQAFPFIVRVLRQRRRNHREIEGALKSVLLSDRGEEALARGSQFDTTIRRTMYGLLLTGESGFQRPIVNTALGDHDAIIRARAVQSVAADAAFEQRADILERLLRHDSAPVVRRLALTALSECAPDRIAGVFPGVLIDSAASVRSLARFLAGRHQLRVVPREFYVQNLTSDLRRHISAAIEGVGETGTRADAELVTPFLSAPRPRNRRAAMKALARLDVERGVTAAIAALADDTSSVRSAASAILSINASRVDFAIVSQRVRALTDPRARRGLLRLFSKAPKWEAIALLLETLADPDEDIRTYASRLVARWVENFNRSHTQPTASQVQRIRTLLNSAAPQLPEETAKMLRFSIR